MRQNLFLGWGLLWVMLFTFHSCSNEMDSDSESDEEAVNLRLSADSVLTRGKPWDEETPMEWAETVEGTGRFMPGYIYYFYLDKKPESKNDEDAGYYAFLIGEQDLVRMVLEMKWHKNIICKFNGVIQNIHLSGIISIWRIISMDLLKYFVANCLMIFLHMLFRIR
ncbi:hypothetical protein NXW00_06570 [Bacteroides thetaiotaomicron]|nr:hypothetical protein [Bacteroides thetaiotaomicron]